MVLGIRPVLKIRKVRDLARHLTAFQIIKDALDMLSG